VDDWKIEKRKGACETCGKAFAVRQAFFAALVDTGPAFVRHEFCEACWPSQDPARFFSCWKTSMPAPEDGPKRADVEAAEDTFDRLIREPAPDPARQRLAFLLSLLLLQRRRLKLLETVTRDGREVLRFERTEDRAVVEVANPGIPETELASLKSEMDALLR